MPMNYPTWERRDDADARELGLAMFQWCRVNRAREEVVDARYWICKPSRFAALIEFEPDANPLAMPESKEWAQALSALVALASSPDSEVWVDPQAGARILDQLS